ncbi:MAG: hypothetical protein KF861_14390, partial [Planctomycetaceae bacterium]|nr:hypothetical protein [Planctomycetaceae bacterium]
MLPFPTIRLRPGVEARRIVITGLGAVSAAGNSVDALWRALSAAPDTDDPSVLRSCEATEFRGRIEDFGELPGGVQKAVRKSLKLMNRETQLGVAAGLQALQASGLLEAGDHHRNRIGVCFGADNVSLQPDDFRAGIAACADGGTLHLDRWGTTGLAEVAPLWLLTCLPNMPACHLAIISDLQGPNNTVTQRHVAANMAVAEACRKIRAGEADAMLVGATGNMLSPFNLIRARGEGDLADEGEPAVCRPFDRRRTGPAPGEGAAALVLEALDSAERRGVPIAGEILAAASTSRIAHPRAAACTHALVTAMQNTLSQSGADLRSIGHIHAHGLGTLLSDAAEAAAIAHVFGEPDSQPPVVAAKGLLSYAGAGSGALELISSLLALQNGELFATMNADEPDPDCSVRLVRERGVPAG